MSQAKETTPPSPAREPRHIDALIVGAGFGGMYMLHRLRGLGLNCQVIEAGTGVGGTWYWNRYPGARCDIESMQYSYSFSPELQQEWSWTERYAAQPEILRYANHVADRFDLRRDIRFETRVVSAHFDANANRWAVTTDNGDRYSARYCVMATGCLSNARLPDIKGRDNFQGATYHTGHWPHEGVDLSGKRVGVIGTGSSAIQAIPVIAETAQHLLVFQRTPNYSIPARNGPMTRDYEDMWKADYEQRRAQARMTRNGILANFNDQSALEVPETTRRRNYEARWVTGGTTFMAVLQRPDHLEGRERHGGRVRARADPGHRQGPEGGRAAGAERLSDRDQAHLRRHALLRDVQSRQRHSGRSALVADRGDHRRPAFARAEQSFDLDAIVFATGFDAMTGTLLKIDIRGRNGARLSDKWEAGPRTYLGLMCADFPNMFMITGPGSPSVLSNMMVSIEQHVDWITDCLGYMGHRQISVIEPTQKAEDDWVAHVNEVAGKTLYPAAASWYMGANIPGKPRVFMPYIGGVGRYRKHCDGRRGQGLRGLRDGRRTERCGLRRL